MPAKKQNKKTTKMRDLKPKNKTSMTKGGAASLQSGSPMRSPAASFGNPPGSL